MSNERVIVCAVDGSEFSSEVIEHALDEAHRWPNAVVHFVQVVEKRPRSVGEGELEEAEAELRRLIGDVLPAFETREPGDRRIRVHIRSGHPVDEIADLCAEARADCLVLGRHGSSGKKRKPGGVPSTILEHLRCSALVVQTADYPEELEDCPKCIAVRAESEGENWFCEEHSGGRIPRLVRYTGSSSMTPGWGLW